MCDEHVVQTCMHVVTISETWHENLHNELYMCIAHDGFWELKGTEQLLVTQHCLRYVHRVLMMCVEASLHGAGAESVCMQQLDAHPLVMTPWFSRVLIQPQPEASSWQ